MKPKTNRRKRGNREGSVYFDKGRKRWRCTLSYYRDGKLVRVSKSGDTKAEAQDELRKLQNQHADGKLATRSRDSMEDVLNQWADLLEKKPATIDAYKRTIRKHLIPAIGNVRISDAKPSHVKRVLAGMTGLSASSRKRAYDILSAVFEQAIDDDILAANPCARVHRPVETRHERPVLSREQAAAFLKHAQQDRLHALYVLALTTGMRQGELLGLKWTDIDWTAGTLTIRRTLQLVGKDWHVGTPKTKASQRRLTLSAMAVEALHEHRAMMMREGLAGREWVFLGRRGAFIRRTELLRAHFRPLLEKSGLPDMTFHDLRHSAATILFQMETHPRIVQEQLGHTSIRTTLDLYTHAIPGMSAQVASKMDAALGAQVGATVGANSA